MRVLAFTFVLLGLPAVAVAAPVHRLGGFNADLVQHDAPRLRLPGDVTYGSPVNRTDDNQIFNLKPQTGTGEPASGMSFGPIHAESEIVNGKRRMHYHVDGFTVMGGQIGGSVGHGGAMLTLHWGN